MCQVCSTFLQHVPVLHSSANSNLAISLHYSMLYTLHTQFHNYMEVVYLPLYTPSEAEKKDPRLYAYNVRKLMVSGPRENQRALWFTPHSLFRDYVTSQPLNCLPKLLQGWWAGSSYIRACLRGCDAPDRGHQKAIPCIQGATGGQKITGLVWYTESHQRELESVPRQGTYTITIHSCVASLIFSVSFN